MKIKIEFTVGVDQQAWADEYGIDLKDVRADVKMYCRDACVMQIQEMGLAQ